LKYPGFDVNDLLKKKYENIRVLNIKTYNISLEDRMEESKKMTFFQRIQRIMKLKHSMIYK
jgi:hypothetical protein